jgi:hypothetical protein
VRLVAGFNPKQHSLSVLNEHHPPCEGAAEVIGSRLVTFYGVKIKDPSFANWPALHYAILENIVPDCPLVNKSFAYAANDL